MSARVSFSLAFLGGAILGGLIWLAQNVHPLLPLAVIAVVIILLAYPWQYRLRMIQSRIRAK